MVEFIGSIQLKHHLLKIKQDIYRETRPKTACISDRRCSVLFQGSSLPEHFSPQKKPQSAAVCRVRLRLSFQFSPGYSSSDQFSMIPFNSVCFTWKRLTLLTGSSRGPSVCCSPTGSMLHHVCVCWEKDIRTDTAQVCVNVKPLPFFLSSSNQTTVIWKPHISRKSAFEEYWGESDVSFETFC